jgi:NAD(P) transhydrogenase subunit alpha
VGVLAETAVGERRVSLTPDVVGHVTRLGLRVLVEAGAGRRAYFADADYQASGAEVLSREAVLAAATLVLCVHAPPADLLHRGQVLLGMLAPLEQPQLMADLAARGVTAISLDQIPRTLSRAQSMDPLTSQANVAGYKAVLVAADAYPGYFPMLMTAAGTVRPAEVLVLGAGVAGLQAIGTARRLGAVVRGYDVRPEARGEIESLGARYLQVNALSAVGEGGYARALTDAEAKAQRAALQDAVAQHDVVITTAQVPGRCPPVLVTASAVARMRAGSVLVDLAAGPAGGNVEGSVPGQTVVTEGGVVVIGAGNLPSTVPRASSTAYSRNVAAVVGSLCAEGHLTVDVQDEVHAAIVITRDGGVVHAGTAALLAGPEQEVRDESGLVH